MEQLKPSLAASFCCKLLSVAAGSRILPNLLPTVLSICLSKSDFQAIGQYTIELVQINSSLNLNVFFQEKKLFSLNVMFSRDGEYPPTVRKPFQ